MATGFQMEEVRLVRDRGRPDNVIVMINAATAASSTGQLPIRCVGGSNNRNICLKYTEWLVIFTVYQDQAE